MKVGRILKTQGGWKARIIWIPSSDLQKGFYAIHKPGTSEESMPIYHWQDGTAHSVLSVNEPPRYSKSTPADIILP